MSIKLRIELRTNLLVVVVVIIIIIIIIIQPRNVSLSRKSWYHWHSGTMVVSVAIFKCLCQSSAEGSFLRRSLWTLRKVHVDAIILHYFASMTTPRAVFQFDKGWESQIKARSMY